MSCLHLAAACGTLIVGLVVSLSTLAQNADETAAGDWRTWSSVATLKGEYLRCDRVSSQRRLSPHAFAYCADVGEQLLAREFSGDVDRLLTWWRAERASQTAAVRR